jgi:hypothetical protein
LLSATQVRPVSAGLEPSSGRSPDDRAVWTLADVTSGRWTNQPLPGRRRSEAQERIQAEEGLPILHLNREAAPDADISAAPSSVRTLVISSREDMEIAREVRRTLSRDRAG